MVNQTLEYVKSCSLKAKKLQHLSEHLVTNGPEGTVLSVFQVTGALKKSLQKWRITLKGNSRLIFTIFCIDLNIG